MSMLEVIETDDGGHYYEFDGQRVPGVSEILEAADVLIKNSFYEERREVAAIRGRDVHMACADLDRKRPDWWSEDPEIVPYVIAYKQFKKDFEFKPTVVETPHLHEIYRYAGTPDRFGSVTLRDGSTPVTLDLKATSAIGCHVALQLAGYNLFADDHDERDPVALQLKPNGKYQLHSYRDERSHNEAVFLACLSLTMWRRRHLK